jgi:transposase
MQLWRDEIMRTLKLTMHLSVDDLYHRYRDATDPVARSHWHILWLVAQGRPGKEVAHLTGYSDTWVYAIVRRYNADGPDAVGDQRHQNPGKAPMVPPEVLQELDDLLDGPAPDGGLWTSKKVAAWVAQRLGLDHVHIGRGWELLRQLGYRSYAPRPRHQKADPAEQAAWKKKLPDEIAAIQAAHPEVRSWELWTMDEHRIGLKPILRRIWAPKGERPHVTVHQRYRWRYVYGFVCPQSGETFWLILPTVSIAVFSQALAALAEGLGIGPDKHIILVLDRAGWHTSDRVEVPEGIHLVFQPAYSPELQPAERLWAVTDEALANECFATIDDLVDAQADRCETISTQQDDIRSRTLYHWWPLIEEQQNSVRN